MTNRILKTEEEKKETRRNYNLRLDVKNKNAIRNSVSSLCDCGKTYTYSHKNQHKNKCVWHINYMLALNTGKPLPKYGSEEYKEHIRQIEIEQLKELMKCPKYQETLKSQNKVLSEDKTYIVYH